MAVIDFTKAKAELDPHISGDARCLACKHEWVAVAPIGTIWLECPACKDDYDGETCETCGYTAAAHKEGTDA